MTDYPTVASVLSTADAKRLPRPDVAPEPGPDLDDAA